MLLTAQRHFLLTRFSIRAISSTVSFFHGNTELNNFESETVPQGVYDRIDTIDDLIKPSEIIGWPSYLDEFESCPSQAAMCCWTADKFSAGGGTCASEGGCADAEPADNTDICHHDMSKSPLAARVRAGAAVFSGDSEGAAHCQAFVWDDSTAAFNGNLLFDAVNYGMDNGYTRAVPGAPMCGCVEHVRGLVACMIFLKFVSYLFYVF